MIFSVLEISSRFFTLPLLSGASCVNASKETSKSSAKHIRLPVLGLDTPLSHFDTCRVHSVDTKSEIVKILHFKQFYKHYVFNEDGDGGRKKVLKNYIDVYVCIDMVCGDTKGELGNEE